MYKDKLKALRRVSRALFKRVSEAEKRPKLLANFASSLNISHDFLARMKNLSSEVQIFTEVEITSLEKLIDEAEVCVEGGGKGGGEGGGGGGGGGGGPAFLSVRLCVCIDHCLNITRHNTTLE